MRRFVQIALVLLWVLVCSTTIVRPVQAQEQRLVLAFYYAWYDEKTWSPNVVPDVPLEPYRSADRATIERHVREARGAGIDALVQSWYGPGSNPTESNLATLLAVAAQEGMRASVDFEVGSPFMPTLESLIDGLAHLLRVHTQHPAFLRHGGRPVIFFWQQQRLSVGQWASIRSQVDPNHETVWIADADDPAWLEVFDGLHLYNITWAVNTNPLYTATKMRKRVDQYVAEHGGERYWVATAMPGYDDTHVEGRANPYVYPRSPAYYRSTWDAAMASAPEMVIVTSYNEWREGTMIEPSVTYGTTYLDLTRELAATYKGGTLPAQVNVPTATYTPTRAPQPTETATATTTSTSAPSPSATATATAAATATATMTLTPSPAATATATQTPTSTPSPTLTRTPWPPTATPHATAPKASQTFAVANTYTPTESSAPRMSEPADGPSAEDTSCTGAGMVLGAMIGLALWRTRVPMLRKE